MIIPALPHAPRPGLALSAAAFVLAIAGPIAHAGEPTGEPVSLQGSTVFSARLIEPRRAEIERLAGRPLVVVPNKSSHGLVALLQGRTHMAMISSTLGAELAVVRQSWPSLAFDALHSHEIDRTRIAFARHPANPVATMTLDQLRRVLLGELRNWRELGGPDVAIAVVSVKPGGGVPTTVRTLVLDGQPFAPHRLIEVEAPRHVIKVVEQEPGAIGITQLNLVRQHMTPEIAMDRIVEQELNLVTLGPPTPAQRAVIEAIRKTAAQPSQ